MKNLWVCVRQGLKRQLSLLLRIIQHDVSVLSGHGQRSRLSLGLLFVAVAGVIVCHPALGEGKKNEVIRIGAVVPLTGELAKFGEMQRNAYQMALAHINQGGGVKGRKLKIIIRDDAGKPEVGRAAVERMISRDNILALTGGYSSAVTYAVAGVAQQYHIPYCIHSGAADSITEQHWDSIFRINQPTSEYFKGLLTFMTEVAKPKTAVVMHENTLFGQSQGKSFAQACEKTGCKVLMKEGFESGSEDFRPMLTRIKELNPDLVYAICYAMDAALIARQCKELNFRPKLFVGGGAGFSLPEFPQDAGDAADLIYCTTLWSEHLPFPGARQFYEEYCREFKEPPQFQGAQAYVALFVIADAIDRAKEITPAGIREALAGTDMQSMYGQIKFISYGKKTQQNSLPTYLGQWQAGAFELVWPREYAVKPFVYPVPPWSQ